MRNTLLLGFTAIVCGGGSWAARAANHPTGKFHLHFNGDGQYVEIPSAADLSFSSAGFSVSAWLRPGTLEFAKSEGSGYVHWIGKGERNRQEWALRMYSLANRETPPRPNRISFYLFNPDGGLGQGSYVQEPVRLGEWIQITAVAHNGETAIYRNGKYVRCDEINGPTGHGCQAHKERIQPKPGDTTDRHTGFEEFLRRRDFARAHLESRAHGQRRSPALSEQPRAATGAGRRVEVG